MTTATICRPEWLKLFQGLQGCYRVSVYATGGSGYYTKHNYDYSRLVKACCGEPNYYGTRYMTDNDAYVVVPRDLTALVRGFRQHNSRGPQHLQNNPQVRQDDIGIISQVMRSYSRVVRGVREVWSGRFQVLNKLKKAMSHFFLEGFRGKVLWRISSKIPYMSYSLPYPSPQVPLPFKLPMWSV